MQVQTRKLVAAVSWAAGLRDPRRAELESTKGCLACSNLTVVLPGGPHKGQ